jgi:hypothetical protein
MSKNYSSPTKDNKSKSNSTSLDRLLEAATNHSKKRIYEDDDNNDNNDYEQEVSAPQVISRKSFNETMGYSSESSKSSGSSSSDSESSSEEGDEQDDLSVEELDYSKFITVEKSESDVDEEDMHSDIEEEVDSYVELIKVFNLIDSTGKSFESNAIDADSKLLPTCLRSMDKSQFSKAYLQCAAFNGFTRKQTKSLFTLLNMAVPSVNWPVNFMNDGFSIDPNLEDYACSDVRSHEIQVCMNGCMSFTGKFVSISNAV